MALYLKFNEMNQIPAIEDIEKNIVPLLNSMTPIVQGVEFAGILDLLAAIYKNFFKNEKYTEWLYINICNVWQKKSQFTQSVDDCYLYSNALYNLGGLYNQTRELDKAYHMFELVYIIRMNLLSKFNLTQEQRWTLETSLGDVYNMFSFVYHFKNDLDNCEKFQKKSLKIRKLQKDLLPEKYALSCNNMAMFLLKKQKYHESLNYLSQAISIIAKVKQYNPKFGMFWSKYIYNSGQVYFQLQQFEKAFGLFKVALSINVLVFGNQIQISDEFVGYQQKYAQHYKQFPAQLGLLDVITLEDVSFLSAESLLKLCENFPSAESLLKV